MSSCDTQYIRTFVDRELDDLAHLAAERVRLAGGRLRARAALDGELLRRNIIRAARVVEAVALEAPDGGACAV